MQGRRGGRDPFFDFGGFGAPTSSMSSVFGGRDPFDDPFFTRPFGGMFESSFFRSGRSPFTDMLPMLPMQSMHPMHPMHTMDPSAFREHQPPPEPRRSRGPIIEELNSDDEKAAVDEEKKNPRKHGRSRPLIREPDDGVEERRSKQLQAINDYGMYNVAQQQPQTHNFTFSSSTVTYGGSDGAYYTKSKTRRMGSDGITFEESREADTSTRQAKHLVSRGLHNKGHTVTRKLDSDGKVDTMQTLHNLNEDELSGFDEAWNGSARKYMPGWTGASSSGLNEQASRGGWALPSTEQPQNSGRVIVDRAGSSSVQRPRKKKN